MCQHRQEQRRVLEKWNLLLDLIEVPRSSTRVVSPVLTSFFINIYVVKVCMETLHLQMT